MYREYQEVRKADPEGGRIIPGRVCVMIILFYTHLIRFTGRTTKDCKRAFLSYSIHLPPIQPENNPYCKTKIWHQAG